MTTIYTQAQAAMLADGIRNAAIERGIIRKDAIVDGPQLILICNDLGHVDDARPLAAAVQSLVDTCHGASRDAGWWPDEVRSNPMVFSQKLMLTVSELAEAMEGDRKNLMDDKLPHRPMREVELADALIRICDLAGAFGMDLGGAVDEKMAFNRTREDHQIATRNADGGKKY